MPSVGDIIEVKDFQSLANVSGEILNVYHFEVASLGTATSLQQIDEDFRDWWYDTFLTSILAVQTSGTTHTRIEVNNLNAYATEFFIITPLNPSNGDVIGEFSSSSAAWSIELVRTLRTTRNGGKRIAGVPEDFTSNNVATATAIGLLQDVTDNMSAGQQVPYGVAQQMAMLPVIIRRGIPPSHVPQVVNPVGAAVYRGVGSQTSRKQLL